MIVKEFSFQNVGVMGEDVLGEQKKEWMTLLL